MKNYTEYNHEEIETIAEKFTKGEFVNHEELKLWYEYKKAVKTYLKSGESYFQALEEKSEGEYSEVTKKLQHDYKMAQGELNWIRSIKTYPIKKFCDYYWKNTYYSHSDLTHRPTYIMAKRVAEGVSETEEQFVREIFEESETLKSINHFRDLTTPVQLRRWTYMKRNPTEYCPTVSSCDATQLYDKKEHYVYIQSECNIHRWGESYWISVDCDNTLYSLPVIKDFKNYDFQVGKFYKITCTDTIHFGGNKKKYVMDIQESTEEEFMNKGFDNYVKRW